MIDSEDMAVSPGMVLLSDGCSSGDGPTQRWLFLRGWSFSAMAVSPGMVLLSDGFSSGDVFFPREIIFLRGWQSLTKWFEHNDMALRIWLFLSGYGANSGMAASQVHCRKNSYLSIRKTINYCCWKNLLPTTKFYPVPNFPSVKSVWGKLGDTFG
jgi:hypothetical protein